MRSGAPDLSSPSQVLPVAYAVPVTRDTDGNPTVGSSNDAVELAGWHHAQQITGWAIPGNLRGASGFAIASGGLSFAAPAAGVPGDGDTYGSGDPYGSDPLFGGGGSLAVASPPFASSQPSRLRPWDASSMPPVFDGREFAILLRFEPLTAVESPMAGWVTGIFKADPIDGRLSRVEHGVEFAQTWVDDEPIVRADWVSAPDEPLSFGEELFWELQVDATSEPSNFPHSWKPLGDGVTSASLTAQFPEQLTSWAPGRDQTLTSFLTELVTGVGGAAWPIVHDGRWRLRNYDELRNGTPVATVNVHEEADDLAWTSAQSEVYDGVSVNYRQLRWSEKSDGYQVWSADSIERLEYHDVIELGAPAWDMLDETFVAGGRTNANGFGGDVDVTVAFERRTPVLVEGWWSSSDAGWLVTSAGDPSGQARATWWASWAEAQAAAGATTGKVFELPVGQSVQTHEVASEIAGRLLRLVRQRRWRADRIRIVPQLGLEVGDTINLVHEPSGLDVRVLVIGMELSAAAGELTQLIDVAVIQPTVGDFNTWADGALGTSATVGDFNTWADTNLGPAASLADFNNYWQN